MKILLSAYACEPNRGSEQGVGWGWAMELSKQHEVWVLTRERNKDRIEKYLSEHPEISEKNLHFIYVGLSKKITFWKRGNRGIRLYYWLWQRKALQVAKTYLNKVSFDYIQHVTFVSYTQPTYLYKLGIPLVWGPVSGGECIPKELKIDMTFREKIIEYIRGLSQKLAILMPSVNGTMKNCKLILCATEETKKMIPIKYATKTFVIPAIGLTELPEPKKITSTPPRKIKVIMAGRLIYWKAFDIGVRAYKSLAEEFPDSELHILGEGNRKNELINIAGDLLNKQIFFEPHVLHDQIYEFYKGYDLFLNTTLRDSGCMTMMEALAVGLPCIAISTGGPRELGNSMPVKCIEPSNYQDTVKRVADKLRDAFRECSNNRSDNQLIISKRDVLLYENRIDRKSVV